MAVVKGVKEKVHLPIYDSVVVKPGMRLGESQSSNVLRFFQDVNGKTKLQTNMQASSLLPHWNTFEARALRVVISDLEPVYSMRQTVDLQELAVLTASSGKGASTSQRVSAALKGLTVNDYVLLTRWVEASEDHRIRLFPWDLETLSSQGRRVTSEPTLKDSESLEVRSNDLVRLRLALEGAEAKVPPAGQIHRSNGSDDVISRLIYNSVTTLFVGEKIMIQMPTWFFPAGAGPYAEDGGVITHGYPSPEATFRFAEPIFIDTQQNFRVEIEIPEGDVLNELRCIYGPLFIWVVIDGYMTRDVQ